MKKSNAEVQERRQLLLELLKSGHVATIKELSEELKVSEMTIRRDCAILSAMGQIKQSYGKLTYLKSAEEVQAKASDPIETIKHLLAKEAARFISEGDNLFINTSSTAIQVLTYLKNKGINLLTNNTNAITMEHHPRSTIILSGGEVRFPKVALFGDIALESFARSRSDISVIGCSGLDLKTGISTSVIHEARINAKMIENSGKLIIVADYRKIGKPSNFTIGSIQDIDILITDTFADYKTVDALERQGVQVIQVPI